MLTQPDADFSIGGAVVPLPIDRGFAVRDGAPRPRWLGAAERVHASGADLFATAIDGLIVAGAVVLSTHSVITAVFSACLFMVAGALTGLYTERTTVESQGILWYLRELFVPLVVLAAGLRWVAPGSLHSPQILPAVGLTAGGLIAVRSATWAVIAVARRRGLGLRTTLLVGPPQATDKVAHRLATFPEAGLKFGAVYSPETGLADCERRKIAFELLHEGRIEHVLFIGDGLDESLFESFVHEGEGHDVGYSLVLPLSQLSRQRARHRIGELGVVPLGRLDFSCRTWGKRTVDILFTSVALLVVAPVMLAAAAAVWLYDRGPIFYKQPRVGRSGRIFTMFKFRSMVVNADENIRLDAIARGNSLLFKMDNDPRVTPIGRLLRRTAIDELPQLLNVLRGDMSIVGPRPLAVEPEAFDETATKRHSVLPGITGLWQVEGANALPYEDMIRLDLAYIATWSLGLDLWLMLRTIPVLLVRRDPY